MPKAAATLTGAKDAAPPEGEGNPAEGGCFASAYMVRIYAIYSIMNDSEDDTCVPGNHSGGGHNRVIIVKLWNLH